MIRHPELLVLKRPAATWDLYRFVWRRRATGPRQVLVGRYRLRRYALGAMTRCERRAR